MATKREWSAGGVLDVLRKGPMPEGAHAWLYEVRNGTGYRRQERYADALVVSCWPSRGIWIAGIEVKVDRQDWKHELDEPTKSDEIQRFCDFWFLATPEDIVRDGELPEKWGHYIVNGKGAKLVKPAPKLEPQPLTAAFVASVLRNQSQMLDGARQAGRDAVWQEAQAKLVDVHELERRVHDAQHEQRTAEAKLKYAQNDVASMKAALDEFEQRTGVRVHGTGYRHGENIAAQFKLAEYLYGHDPRELAARLKAIAAELDALPSRDAVIPCPRCGSVGPGPCGHAEVVGNMGRG